MNDATVQLVTSRVPILVEARRRAERYRAQVVDSWPDDPADHARIHASQTMMLTIDRDVGDALAEYVPPVDHSDHPDAEELGLEPPELPDREVLGWIAEARDRYAAVKAHDGLEVDFAAWDERLNALEQTIAAAPTTPSP